MSEQNILRASVMSLALASCLITGCARIITPTGVEFNGETGGCGDFLIYRFNDNKTLAVRVLVDEKAFAISGAPITVEIAMDSQAAFVEVLQFYRPAIDYFCDDVGGDSAPIATWKAVSGKIAIEKYEVVQAGTVGNATHKVSVVLRNIRVRHAKTKQEVTLDDVRFDNVLVGWKA